MPSQLGKRDRFLMTDEFIGKKMRDYQPKRALCRPEFRFIGQNELFIGQTHPNGKLAW
jgi:hypothetical protein